MESSLPVIDYSESLRDPAKQALRIVEIMKDPGFLFLDNIPGYSEDDLRWCVEFFFDVMPEKKKMEVAKQAYNPQNKQLFRGYFGVNKVGSSFKEAFEIGRDLPVDDPDYKTSFPISEHNIWPKADAGEDSEAYEKFKNRIVGFYSLFFDVALHLLRLLARGVGLKECYYDPLFTKTISTLRLINYPVHNFDIPPDAYAEDGKLISTAQHRDTSALTLLSTFDYEGLQVLMKDGSWLDVVPRKNSLVVNLGAMFVRMVEDKLQATMHRVLAIGRPRRSVPFFFEPSFHAMLPKHLPADANTEESALDHPQEDCFKYGIGMVKRTMQFVEYHNLLDLLIENNPNMKAEVADFDAADKQNHFR